MSRLRNIVFFALMCVHFLCAAQNFALKTNSLCWLTTTPNLSAEVGLGHNSTFEIFGAYNPWTFTDDKKMKCWVVKPEFKLWMCDRWEGHFVGVHAFVGQYYGGFNSRRYDGYLAGGGISYGYDWILSPHWNLELEAGVGYARLWYKKSPRIPCMTSEVKEKKNYFGPTILSVTFTYLF